MINFKAVHWTDLIDLSVNGVCEPPLTLDFSEITEFIVNWWKD